MWFLFLCSLVSFLISSNFNILDPDVFRVLSNFSVPTDFPDPALSWHHCRKLKEHEGEERVSLKSKYLIPLLQFFYDKRMLSANTGTQVNGSDSKESNVQLMCWVRTHFTLVWVLWKCKWRQGAGNSSFMLSLQKSRPLQLCLQDDKYRLEIIGESYPWLCFSAASTESTCIPLKREITTVFPRK